MIDPLSVSPGDKLGPPGEMVRRATGVEYTPGTISRLIHQGRNGVRLKVAMVSGRPMTTEAAVLEFVEACTSQAAGPANVSA